MSPSCACASFSPLDAGRRLGVGHVRAAAAQRVAQVELTDAKLRHALLRLLQKPARGLPGQKVQTGLKLLPVRRKLHRPGLRLGLPVQQRLPALLRLLHALRRRPAGRSLL